MINFKNIKPKIIVALFIIVIGILFVSETFHYLDTKQTLSSELEDTAERKITRMASEYIVPLWEVDAGWVKIDIDTEMMDKLIYAIVVSGEGDVYEGRMRDDQWQAVAIAGQITGDLITRESDVIHNGEIIGSVKIYLSKKFMNDALREQVQRAILTIFLISVSMLSFMVITLNKIIILPLQHILGVTQAYAKGDYSLDVGLKQADEVGRLADGINLMRSSISLREGERDVAETQLRKKTRALQTANVELDKHREHLEEEVKERTEELEAANAQLKELDHLKSMFIASMSHELRTPLNSIIGFTGITLDGLTGEINDTQRDQLQRSYNAAKHLLSLINDIIDISKIEAGRIDVFPAEFSLQEIVDEAVGVIQPLAASKNLSLNVDVPVDIILYSDRQRLLQCIINLTGNAVKFTEIGSVTVSAREIGDGVEIAVSDTGIGIKKVDLPKLFEAFERLDSKLRIKAGGTGLGLYLTQKICTTLLQGKVSVESTPDKGSTFSLKLPKRLENGEQTIPPRI